MGDFLVYMFLFYCLCVFLCFLRDDFQICFLLKFDVILVAFGIRFLSGLARLAGWLGLAGLAWLGQLASLGTPGRPRYWPGGGKMLLWGPRFYQSQIARSSDLDTQELPRSEPGITRPGEGKMLLWGPRPYQSQIARSSDPDTRQMA